MGEAGQAQSPSILREQLFATLGRELSLRSPRKLLGHLTTEELAQKAQNAFAQNAAQGCDGGEDDAGGDDVDVDDLDRGSGGGDAPAVFRRAASWSNPPSADRHRSMSPLAAASGEQPVFDLDIFGPSPAAGHESPAAAYAAAYAKYAGATAAYVKAEPPRRPPSSTADFVDDDDEESDGEAPRLHGGGGWGGRWDEARRDEREEDGAARHHRRRCKHSTRSQM